MTYCTQGCPFGTTYDTFYQCYNFNSNATSTATGVSAPCAYSGEFSNISTQISYSIGANQYYNYRETLCVCCEDTINDGCQANPTTPYACPLPGCVS